MKRSPYFTPKHFTPKQKSEIVSWVQYITVVLAFIGLWQLLSGGLTAIDRWL